MAVRPTERKQGNLTALAVSLVLATGFVTSANGAPVHGTLCSETHDATLEVSEIELTASLVNHEMESQDSADKVDTLAADHLLRPRAAATIREVFADGDDEAEQSETAQAEADEAVIMNTRVPGYSDDELTRFKRQMYRKDI
jgi:hypothetical protein